MNKKVYNNSDVVLIASEPASRRRSYSEARMGRIRQSSRDILEMIDKINKDYPKPHAEVFSKYTYNK